MSNQMSILFSSFLFSDLVFSFLTTLFLYFQICVVIINKKKLCVASSSQNDCCPTDEAYKWVSISMTSPLPCVSGIWTSLTWWFSLRLEPLLDNDRAIPKIDAHVKSGQWWHQSHHLPTLAKFKSQSWYTLYNSLNNSSQLDWVTFVWQGNKRFSKTRSVWNQFKDYCYRGFVMDNV